MSNFGGYLTLFHMVDLILTIFFLVLGLVIVMLLSETCTILVNNSWTCGKDYAITFFLIQEADHCD